MSIFQTLLKNLWFLLTRDKLSCSVVDVAWFEGIDESGWEKIRD